MLSRLRSLIAFIRYNMGHIFAGKTPYFLLLAIGIFLAVVVIHAYNVAVPPGPAAIYYFLLTPGVLLIFYPSAYALQADVDARMLETLFGIPDYRYKVWLSRHLIQQLAVALLLLPLALFCRLALADFSLLLMLFHLLFPIFFLSSLGFALASFTRSGNATAVVLVVLALFFWILHEPLVGSPWNLFHNPFAQIEEFAALLQGETTFYNRIYLLAGSILAILFALLRLRRREKFI